MPKLKESSQVYCWAATDVGLLRQANEDAFATSSQAPNELPSAWEGSLGAEAWAIVADGMGGHAAGEVASILAIECLRTVLRPDFSREELVASINATNLALYDAMALRPELTGMGTTIVGVLVRTASALVFNVGDSRAYLQWDGELHMVSEDHVVAGNQLTQCLGGLSDPASVHPHIDEIPVKNGSKVLLCTDGLTDELTNEQISACLMRNAPVEALIEAALAAGGRDNITAVVIEVGRESLKPHARPSSPLRLR